MRIFNEIERFNRERNLLKPFDKKLELEMAEEELQEVRDAQTPEEMAKEFFDQIVVATGSILKLGFIPQKIGEETMKQIQSRTGAINEAGKWCKDKAQDPDTLYTPNFESCKIKNRKERR